MQRIWTGRRIPDVKFGYVEAGEIRSVSANSIFAFSRSVAIGIPGAFTPVCTKRHIPDFIKNAEKLRASGYSQLICIAPNDPFVLAEWAREVDPEQKLRFLSDGNLDFTRMLGLLKENREYFLGYRSERYMMIVHNCTIARLRVEADILSYTCTTADDALEEPAA